MKITLGMLEEAYLYGSAGTLFESAAWINRVTGQTYFWNEDYSPEPEPEDFEDGDWVQVPNQRELSMGTPVVMAFARTLPEEMAADIRDIFQYRGAFRRFKDYLHRQGKLEAWYAFEAAELEKCLREWAELEGITVVDEKDAR